MDAKVYELARRARELLVSKYTELGIESQAARLMEQGHQPGGVHYGAVQAIIAALTPPEGHVVVTRNEAGQAVAVTRQDDEGRILSVIAEFGTPEGYVLVPVEPTVEMVVAGNEAENESKFASEIYGAMLAARPEVPNVND